MGGGGGGGWMETEARLSTGAFEAMWREDGQRQRPVLQLADEPRTAVVVGPAAEAGPYRVALSDGGDRLQPGVLAASLNDLVVRGALRRGTVIRVLEYFAGFYHNQRVIILIQLEILHAECKLIRNPTIFEANPSQHIGASYSSGLAIHEPCFVPTQQVISNSSSSPDKRVLDSSVTPKAGPTVINVPFSEIAQCTVGAKMQQLSLNDRQNQPNDQSTNFPANAAQANTGTYSSGPGMLQSCAAPSPAQGANNVPYSGSYGGYQGMGPPIDRAVESVRNVASGVSYDTASTHNDTMNVGMVQSNLQQPSLNSHQNQWFAVPSMSGGSGAFGNTYGQPAQFYQQSPPGHMNGTPVSKNDASCLVPVAQLNPYQQRWTIKARVTSKTDLRHYNNAKGAHKLFSFDLLDGQGGEIRATCFNAQADQFFDLIKVDKVYLISRGSLKPAQKQFNSLNHEYEITLDSRTSIEVCADDDSNIPRQQYNFRQISEIENIEAGAIVDLIGIVTSVGPSATIIRKDGFETKKRTLQLKDMSGRSIEITLWGKFCDAEGEQLQLQCDSGLNPVLALKGARVSEFCGRYVSSILSTQLKIDPDFPEAESLCQWYATEGKTAACVSLSVVSMGRTVDRKTVAQIKDEDLGRSEKPDFITVIGAISHMNTGNFCYPACTMEVNGRVCNKKVINNGDGTWQCDKCNKSLPNCEYRYLLQCRIQDHTGVTYATAFQEAGIEIVGHSAHELYNIREEDPERFAEILKGVHWQQFLFKLKVKEETFNDEQRVKCSIIRAEKLDPARETMLTSSDANLQVDRASYSSCMLTFRNVGATGFAQSNWMPTLPSASSGGWDLNSGFGFLGQSALRGVSLCFKCNQPGHWSKDCLV